MLKLKKIIALSLIGVSTISSAGMLAETPLSSNASIQPEITTTNAEFVYKYLLAEIAGQRGDTSLASQLFLDLAKKTRDARLAERAARSAAYARQQSLALQAVTLWSELDPDSIEAQQASSQMYIASGNINAAKPHLKKLLAKKEMRVNGFTFLYDLLKGQKDKKMVLEIVQELAEPYPHLPEAHLAVAQAAWFAEKLDIAKNSLSIASELRPGWGKSANMQAQVLQKESPEKALTFYKTFLDQYPNAHDVRMGYAKLLVNQKQFSTAKAQFIQLTSNVKTRPEISVVVGLLSLEANEPTLADEYFQKALADGFKEPDQLHLYLGRSAEQAKNDTNALIWYDKVSRGKHYLEGRLSAANVIVRTKNTDAAIDLLKNVSGLTTEQQIIIVQAQAGILSQDKRYQEAFALIEKTVNRMQNTPELIYDYAMAAERIGKLDLMETELRRVIKIKPDYAPAYNALGYSFADRNIQLKEAKTLIETALKLSPGDHYMLDSLGWVEYRLGNFAEAIVHLRKAYDIQADPEIAAHLGEVLWKQGLQEEAKHIWSNALDTFPSNEVLVSTTEKFKS